jgi:hypothetical protein
MIFFQYHYTESTFRHFVTENIFFTDNVAEFTIPNSFFTVMNTIDRDI